MSASGARIRSRNLLPRPAAPVSPAPCAAAPGGPVGPLCTIMNCQTVLPGLCPLLPAPRSQRPRSPPRHGAGLAACRAGLLPSSPVRRRCCSALCDRPFSEGFAGPGMSIKSHLTRARRPSSPSAADRADGFTSLTMTSAPTIGRDLRDFEVGPGRTVARPTRPAFLRVMTWAPGETADRHDRGPVPCVMPGGHWRGVRPASASAGREEHFERETLAPNLRDLGPYNP
jgi:hypothetical protein